MPRLASTVPSPTDMADPELLPNAFMFGQKIPVDCPPRELQALVPLTDRKPANSVMFALPMMITPALRSLCTTGASEADRMPRRTVDPEVPSVLSWVMMLSFNMIGMPCRTLQSPPIWLDQGFRKRIPGVLPPGATHTSLLVESTCDHFRLRVPLNHGMECVIHLSGPSLVSTN